MDGATGALTFRPTARCLRNVVALFHVLEKENAWRKSSGKPEGFEALRTSKPIVAVGAEHPLQEDILKSDDFHGADGLHGVHDAVCPCPFRTACSCKLTDDVTIASGSQPCRYLEVAFR